MRRFAQTEYGTPKTADRIRMPLAVSWTVKLREQEKACARSESSS